MINFVPLGHFCHFPECGSNAPCLELVLELRLEIPVRAVAEKVPGEEVVPESGGEDDDPLAQLLRYDDLDVVARL